MLHHKNYLWGFLPAAFVAGLLMETSIAKSTISIFITALLSVSIIFICGYLWLQAIIGWKDAYTFGVQPFLITEPVKLIVITLIAKLCWKKNFRIMRSPEGK